MNKTKYKVKITKCTNEDWWYRDQVGAVVFVYEDKIDEDYCLISSCSEDYLLDKKDCEILETIRVGDKEQYMPFDYEIDEKFLLETLFNCPIRVINDGTFIRIDTISNNYIKTSNGDELFYDYLLQVYEYYHKGKWNKCGVKI